MVNRKMGSHLLVPACFAWIYACRPMFRLAHLRSLFYAFRNGVLQDMSSG